MRETDLLLERFQGVQGAASEAKSLVHAEKERGEIKEQMRGQKRRPGGW